MLSGAPFEIQSSDPALLEQATRVAQAFAQPYMRDDVVGIVFLGAIARDYFDQAADIDIGLFKAQASELALPPRFLKIDGFEVQCWSSDYESEVVTPWEMSKRWTYSQGHVHFDPSGRIAQLLQDKVPLRPDERKWLMMSGLTLSEWYISDLSRLWVERGNLISAHHMIDHGLNHFFDMLFGLNNQLVADVKWRYYCAERLERLPQHFRERMQDTMLVRSFSVDDLDRRRGAFSDLWREMKPIIESEAGLTFDEMVELV